MRSGKQLESPNSARVKREDEHSLDVSDNALPSEDVPQKKSESEKPMEFKPSFPKRCMLPFPFWQRLVKAKLDAQFEKFLDVHKKFHVNIPFIRALS